MSTILGYIPLLVGLILMLAGVPAFIKLYEITQDLSTSIILTVFYEIVIFILRPYP